MLNTHFHSLKCILFNPSKYLLYTKMCSKLKHLIQKNCVHKYMFCGVSVQNYAAHFVFPISSQLSLRDQGHIKTIVKIIRLQKFCKRNQFILAFATAHSRLANQSTALDDLPVTAICHALLTTDCFFCLRTAVGVKCNHKRIE